MLLNFGYLYKFIMFHFLLVFQKAEKKILKKASWPKLCNIIFLFLLKVGSVEPVDQQINFASPKY